MKELEEKTAILEKSKANLETKFVSMVKAAEKRKDVQVMISEANALKRKSEECWSFSLYFPNFPSCATLLHENGRELSTFVFSMEVYCLHKD